VVAFDSDEGYWIGCLRHQRSGYFLECPHMAIHFTRAEGLRCARQHLRDLLVAHARRREWAPSEADAPLEAPLPLGTRVEYIGLNSRDLENGVPVHHGEVGVVVEIEPVGAAGTETSWPEDGLSIVRFHGIEGEEDVLRPREFSDDDDGWRSRYREVDDT
jgi:hypothetical protein